MPMVFYHSLCYFVGNLGVFMKNFFFLDAVLSTKIITLAYWILLFGVWVIGAVIIGIGTGTTEENAQFGGGIGIFAGLGLIVFGTLFVRLWAEFMVVMFKIQQNTRRTAEALEKRNNIL